MMPTYISMLRGINVSGQKIVKMELLRQTFEALGFEQVQSYVQSGNVIFKAARTSTTVLSKRIQKKILADFGFLVPVISKTSEDMGKVIKGNPFLKQTGIDVSRLHVSFLLQAPDEASLKKLSAIKSAPDQFRHSGDNVYLYCPNGYGNTKLSNNALERVLSLAATTRNWKTVTTLYQISQEYK
jgi:uncharacterized protein (DUF1697 family)